MNGVHPMKAVRILSFLALIASAACSDEPASSVVGPDSDDSADLSEDINEDAQLADADVDASPPEDQNAETVDSGGDPDVAADTADDQSVDGPDTSLPICEASPELVVEPIWIAGATGLRSDVGAFGRPDAIHLTPEGILLAGDEDYDFEEIHLFDVRTEDPDVRADMLAPLVDWGADPGPGGSGSMEFLGVSGFAQHPETGDLYVMEQRNFRIQVFNQSDPADEAPYFTFDRFVGSRAVDYDAPAEGEFIRLQAGRFDSAGRLFVSDDAKGTLETSRRDVQVLDTDGNFLAKFGDSSYGPLGEEGNLQEPENFAIDEARNRIYVCDEGPKAIVVYAYDDFSYVTRFNTGGLPNGIALDQHGLLYVVTEGESSETHVQVYEPDDYSPISRFGMFSEEADLTPGYLNSPDTILIDADFDLLIIADQGHDRVQGFRLSEIQALACLSPFMAPAHSGEILITEFMKDVANTPDDDAEWLELYNPSESETYDLRGCFLFDEGNEYRIPTILVVEPGQYITLGRSADPDVIGFNPDHSYGSSIKLSDGSDTISLICDSELIDSVSYDGGITFPDERGYSVTLAAGAFDATANDLGENWCSGQTEYAPGEFGTPGAENDECPQ